MITEPLINQLKADLARLEAKQQETGVNLGKNHPQTLRTESEIASLKEKIAIETRKVSTSLSTSVTVGKQKEKELLEAIEKQKKKCSNSARSARELSVLKRDVKTAQRAFEPFPSARRRPASKASRYRPTSPCSTPQPTHRPLAPKILLNMLVSIFLGTLLGVGVALMLELRQPPRALGGRHRRSDRPAGARHHRLDAAAADPRRNAEILLPVPPQTGRRLSAAMTPESPP